MVFSHAKYFSIICTGRHSDTCCTLYTKDNTNLEFIKKDDLYSFGTKFLYKISDIDKINIPYTMCRLDELLDDIEEYYPEDTWLTLQIYDKDLECIYNVSESCENGYGEVRDIIFDFFKTGEYQSVK